MRTWQAQDAKAQFNELLDTALNEGPQLITRHGVETAVLVPIKQWREIAKRAQPKLKDLLLAPEPRTEDLTPPRIDPRLRRTPLLD